MHYVMSSVYLSVMGFISRNEKCFVLTLRDINKRTSPIRYNNKQETFIASIKSWKEKCSFENGER